MAASECGAVSRRRVTIKLKFVGAPEPKKLESIKAILTDSYLDRVEKRNEESKPKK